jgi:hypothetical protein
MWHRENHVNNVLLMLYPIGDHVLRVYNEKNCTLFNFYIVWFGTRFFARSLALLLYSFLRVGP